MPIYIALFIYYAFLLQYFNFLLIFFFSFDPVVFNSHLSSRD